MQKGEGVGWTGVVPAPHDALTGRADPGPINRRQDWSSDVSVAVVVVALALEDFRAESVVCAVIVVADRGIAMELRERFDQDGTILVVLLFLAFIGVVRFKLKLRCTDETNERDGGDGGAKGLSLSGTGNVRFGRDGEHLLRDLFVRPAQSKHGKERRSIGIEGRQHGRARGQGDGTEGRRGRGGGKFGTVTALPSSFEGAAAASASEGPTKGTADKGSGDAGEGKGYITRGDLQEFLLRRMHDLDDDDSPDIASPSSSKSMKRKEVLMELHAQDEASRLFELFRDIATATATSTTKNDVDKLQISKSDFVSRLKSRATAMNLPLALPVSLSMLLVGSSVGIVTPVIPFVVEALNITPGQYGVVVSAFALAKIAGNVPSAVLVERHGRKPYLVYSLTLIAARVGGIGLASQFEHLIFCHLLTGLRVAALSTAATLTVADI